MESETRAGGDHVSETYYFMLQMLPPAREPLRGQLCRRLLTRLRAALRIHTSRHEPAFATTPSAPLRNTMHLCNTLIVISGAGTRAATLGAHRARWLAALVRRVL